MTGLAALEAAINELEAQPQLHAALLLVETRRAVAHDLARLHKRDLHSAPVQMALVAIRRLSKLGALDFAPTNDDLRRLRQWQTLGWPGLIATMMLTSAWRAEYCPLGQVPDWLCPYYSEWVFALPNPFLTAAEATSYHARMAAHIEELARWTERNIGSVAVRSAAEAFVRQQVQLPLGGEGGAVHRVALSRRRILTRMLTGKVQAFEPLLVSRLGRRLRVGFVARVWDDTDEVCAAVGRFEFLSAERFEIVLFSSVPAESKYAEFCQNRAAEFHVLPADVGAAVEDLRHANLDVVVFVGDAATSTEVHGQLSLFRVAGLQIAWSDAGGATGHHEADLWPIPRGKEGGTNLVRGNTRAGVYSGPAVAYALKRGQEPELQYSRADLGFPEDAVILVCVVRAGCAYGAPEQWANILAAAPNACLVVHVLPSQPATPLAIESFHRAIQAAANRRGVAPERISVLAPENASNAESRAIVRLADLYLASVGTSRWTAEALSLGIPVAAFDAYNLRLLEAEGVRELLNLSENAADSISQFAADEEHRHMVRRLFAGVAETGLSCVDTLAASDAFSVLIETAFDELEMEGRARFEENTEILAGPYSDDLPGVLDRARNAIASGDLLTAADAAQLALATDPHNPEVRLVHARVLCQEGRYESAAEYLLAAVQQRVTDAEAWYNLATTLRADGKISESVQALESALRLDPSRADGWLMLIELADASGAVDIAQQAYEALKEAAPTHPQLVELESRFVP